MQDSRKLKLEENKLQKRLRREVGKVIHDFNMIAEGDRVMVCIVLPNTNFSGSPSTSISAFEWLKSVSFGQVPVSTLRN